MGIADRVIDVSVGNLPLALLQLAWPSVLQAVLSNAYSVADFYFVGHLPNKAAAVAATEAIGSSVGISICLYGLHNIIAAGCNAYSSQFKGANDKENLATTFKAAFWSCLVLSSVIAFLGYSSIHFIAMIPQSPNPVVTKNIEEFLGTIILSSPGFGLMLLIDNFYKANGNTVLPLFLEIASLCLNLYLNFAFVWQLGWGIKGSAIASAFSRILPALFGLRLICMGKLNGINVSLFSVSSQDEALVLWTRSIAMFRLGCWQSSSDWTYGAVFTVLIRLSGALGAAEQAGLGAGMRGLEWISFCVSEGFLVANITAVGNLIGANMQRRANLAALMGALMSAVSGCITGLPFICFSEPIARLLSSDADIVKYCAMYIRYQGYVSFGVGFEMASYGAFIGAGKAREVFFTNGSMNILRVPACAFCLFGSRGFFHGLAWSLGLRNSYPPTVGNFECVCAVIAVTAVFKAALFAVWLNLRWFRQLYFKDCTLIMETKPSTTTATAMTMAQVGSPVADNDNDNGNGNGDGIEDGENQAYIELSQVSEHGGKGEAY